MTDFTIATAVDRPYDETLARVRDLLVDAGFGVLTEIDVAATLDAKLGVQTAPRVILGACRPELAHRAIEVDDRIATLLPCNVVVTATEQQGTRVEVFDPSMMTAFNDRPGLAAIANEARSRLSEMLAALTYETEGARA